MNLMSSAWFLPFSIERRLSDLKIKLPDSHFAPRLLNRE
jgi:hypothetical protein